MSNTFGTLFCVTTYGESHGPAIGAIIDGCPAGVPINISKIQEKLDLRKPGQSDITTSRKEQDVVEILSGLYNNITTGTPIHLLIRNTDAKSNDYDHLQKVFRPSHADYTYATKYGIRDHRGGGRSSARETACRVAAGALAQQILDQWNIQIHAYVSKVGTITLTKNYDELDLNTTYQNKVRCPDASTAKQFEDLITQVKEKGDSVGGCITGVIKQVPVGLGEPIYDKFQARLAQAMFSIPAVHGFEYGSGFAGTDLFGSKHNDAFVKDQDTIRTTTNHSGGIQGGITNGMDIHFRVAFKPTATISMEQQTVDQSGESTRLQATGRHDPCVLPRAVPIVEAMMALTLMDFILLNQSTKITDIHVS